VPSWRPRLTNELQNLEVPSRRPRLTNELQNLEVPSWRPRLTKSCLLGRARLFGNHHNGSYYEVPSWHCSTVRQPAKWLLTLRCSLSRARLLLFYVVIYISTSWDEKVPWKHPKSKKVLCAHRPLFTQRKAHAKPGRDLTAASTPAPPATPSTG
jgi:hypothetical protein